MIKKSLFSLLALSLTLVGMPAFAQSNSGKLTGVRGIVTVNDGRNAFTGIANSSIRDGFTITSGAAGGASFVTDSGCTVVLGPNQSLSVAPGNCKQLQASVRNIGEDRVAGAVLPSTAVGDAVIVGTGIAVLLAIIDASRNRNRSKLSPS